MPTAVLTMSAWCRGYLRRSRQAQGAGCAVLGDGERRSARTTASPFCTPRTSRALIELEQGLGTTRHELGHRPHGLLGDLVDRAVRGPAAGRPQAERPGKGENGERLSVLTSCKAIITSIVAAVLWIAFYFLHQSDIFSFRQMVE
jgi:hypothetical protein